MAYWQWGEPSAPHLVVCVHGLSRQGRDFDVLAQALVARAAKAGNAIRVVCPDVAGRGRSDWLKDPMGYQVPQYAADMLALLGQLHAGAAVGTLDWVGTSMGGLIGIVVAGQPGLPLPVPVRRMVLNDVGPAIQWKALERIGTYLGNTGRFDSVQQAADAMWAISTSFGPHTPAEWLALSQAMVKSLDDGAFTLHYDPALAVPFRSVTQATAAEGEAMLWQLYDGIKAQVLITRGAQSDLLSPETAMAMTQRGPMARLAALTEAKKSAVPGQMDVRTGNFSLYPRYAKDGKISSWQGTAELVLEGRDFARISTTAGKIQTLTMGNVVFGLSREQRTKVEGQAQAIAIEQFKARAGEIARGFGFTGYTLREVSVNANDQGGIPRPQMMSMRAKTADASEAVPVEAGKSTVVVTVSGQVQLK